MTLPAKDLKSRPSNTLAETGQDQRYSLKYPSASASRGATAARTECASYLVVDVTVAAAVLDEVSVSDEIWVWVSAWLWQSLWLLLLQ
jgi:hypothetical protein